MMNEYIFLIKYTLHTRWHLSKSRLLWKTVVSLIWILSSWDYDWSLSNSDLEARIHYTIAFGESLLLGWMVLDAALLMFITDRCYFHKVHPSSLSQGNKAEYS